METSGYEHMTKEQLIAELQFVYREWFKLYYKLEELRKSE